MIICCGLAALAVGAAAVVVLLAIGRRLSTRERAACGIVVAASVVYVMWFVFPVI
ncbi:MAG: hypothetical protein KF774_06435 [Planctomyces sp.]|nr:hypothetical protein [Planctomyces sp.]